MLPVPWDETMPVNIAMTIPSMAHRAAVLGNRWGVDGELFINLAFCVQLPVPPWQLSSEELLLCSRRGSHSQVPSAVTYLSCSGDSNPASLKPPAVFGRAVWVRLGASLGADFHAAQCGGAEGTALCWELGTGGEKETSTARKRSAGTQRLGFVLCPLVSSIDKLEEMTPSTFWSSRRNILCHRRKNNPHRSLLGVK